MSVHGGLTVHLAGQDQGPAVGRPLPAHASLQAGLDRPDLAVVQRPDGRDGEVVALHQDKDAARVVRVEGDRFHAVAGFTQGGHHFTVPHVDHLGLMVRGVLDRFGPHQGVGSVRAQPPQRGDLWLTEDDSTSAIGSGDCDREVLGIATGQQATAVEGNDTARPAGGEIGEHRDTLAPVEGLTDPSTGFVSRGVVEPVDVRAVR